MGSQQSTDGAACALVARTEGRPKSSLIPRIPPLAATRCPVGKVTRDPQDWLSTNLTAGRSACASGPRKRHGGDFSPKPLGRRICVTHNLNSEAQARSRYRLSKGQSQDRSRTPRGLGSGSVSDSSWPSVGEFWRTSSLERRDKWRGRSGRPDILPPTVVSASTIDYCCGRMRHETHGWRSSDGITPLISPH